MELADRRVEQMIGADMRNMSVEFREVWLNEELIRVNQDPLGKQGVRIRGNATECQVWLRHLDNGNELYVVLFNNGQGSCAPSAPASAKFAGPFKRAYSDNDCPNVGNYPGKTVAQCEKMCTSTPGCDAFNFRGGCSLRRCGLAHLGNPTWDDPHVVSYRTSSPVRDDQICIAQCHLALYHGAATRCLLRRFVW